MSDMLVATARSAPMRHRLLKPWHPGWYQDGRKRQGYFEGWYFKCVDAGAQHAIALIPGMSLPRDGAGSYASMQRPVEGVCDA